MTIQPSRTVIPADILVLPHKRDEIRRRGRYDRADELKRQIEEAGYGIKDNPHGAHLIFLPIEVIDGSYMAFRRNLLKKVVCLMIDFAFHPNGY